MTVFDKSWVAAANEVLAGHDTGAVPGFRVVLELRMDRAVRTCWVVGEHGTLRFGSEPVEPVDIVAHVPYDMARDAFAHTDQAHFMNELLGSGRLWIDGDFAKARFFYTGLVRNATPEIIERLRAIA